MTRRPISSRRRFLFWMLYAGYLAGLVWVAERLFWRFLFGVPVTSKPDVSQVWDYYYPELRQSGALAAKPDLRDGTLDVLLLGGSVLQQASGAIEDALKVRLKTPLRVFTLAKSAHTSRDSFQKFMRLAGKPFDVVVVYDGINDARMNCCPASEFRDDYTHCTWYREFERRLAAGRITIPDLVIDRTKRGISLGGPTEAEMDFGLEVKNGPAFRRNLSEIVEGCRRSGSTVVLMTFATYLPPNYSRPAFESNSLDYGVGSYHLAAELWGRPEGVMKAMATYNAAILDLAHAHPEVILVDQERLLPHDGRIFSDPCHLTHAGLLAFAANLADALVPALKARRS